MCNSHISTGDYTFPVQNIYKILTKNTNRKYKIAILNLGVTRIKKHGNNIITVTFILITMISSLSVTTFCKEDSQIIRTFPRVVIVYPVYNKNKQIHAKTYNSQKFVNFLNQTSITWKLLVPDFYTQLHFCKPVVNIYNPCFYIK